MTNNQTKWTSEQDELLKQGVRKYGINWTAITAFMKHSRTVNSLIKRWHGKVKFESSMKEFRDNVKRKESQSSEKEEKNQSIGESAPYKKVQNGIPWKKDWTERDDKKVRLLVLESGVLDWNALASAVNADPDETKLRWKIIIYPNTIKNISKIGGALKWSVLQDKILSIGEKQKIDWQGQARFFLPSRTCGSMQARWRRVAKFFQAKETIENKHLAIKECLRRIARKQLQELNKKTEEQKIRAEE